MTATPKSVVVFDLDDTLYLERDYVMSGFAAVGTWACQTRRLAGLEIAARAAFKAGRRGDIFDAALVSLNVVPDSALVAELVEVYRNHRPTIALANDAVEWLAMSRPNVAIALLTDGPGTSQFNKCAALGLTARGFQPIIMTGVLGADYGKPHPFGFRMIEAAHSLPAQQFTYIADNATKDFVTPRRRGWRTVQIVRRHGLHQLPPPDPSYAADRIISSLHDVSE